MANAMIDARQAGGSYRRVEVITGERRRRRWTGEEKARIVAESFEEGANISEVARRNGGSRGLLTVWRRQVAAAVAGNAPSFVPLQIRAESGGGTAVEDKPTELTATWCDLNSAPAYSKPETAERRGAVELRFMTARVF